MSVLEEMAFAGWEGLDPGVRGESEVLVSVLGRVVRDNRRKLRNGREKGDASGCVLEQNGDSETRSGRDDSGFLLERNPRRR